MSDIHEFTTVACPFDDVPRRLRAHFRSDTAMIPLRLNLGDLRLERDVKINLREKSAYPGYRLLDVSWEPKGGGPYPSFHGTLSIADEGVGWSRIDLDGAYQPPFGLIGAAFDATVGHRIASATTTELLAHIKGILIESATAQEPAPASARSSSEDR